MSRPSVLVRGVRRTNTGQMTDPSENPREITSQVSNEDGNDNSRSTEITIMCFYT